MVEMALQDISHNGQRCEPKYNSAIGQVDGANGYDHSSDCVVGDILNLATENSSFDTDTMSNVPSLSTDQLESESSLNEKTLASEFSPTDRQVSLDTETTYSIPNSLMSSDTDTEEQTHNCLEHPQCLDAFKNLDASKETIAQLEESIQSLEEKAAAYANEISILNQSKEQYQKELEMSIKEHEIDNTTITALKNELTNIKKQFENASKDKNNMVMRYASSEKDLLLQKKENEVLEKKLKESLKEVESLSAKVKIIANEKTKLSQAYDSKCGEMANAYKEIDKLKEEISSRDIKIKWTQNKLKSEMDIHKECPGEIERLNLKTSILEEELANFKKENDELQKQLDGSEPNKAFDSQLKEHQANLILQKHENLELENKIKNLTSKYDQLKQENDSLTIQFQDVKAENFELNKKLVSVLEEKSSLNVAAKDLEEKNAKINDLESQLQGHKSKLLELSTEIDKLRQSHHDLTSELEICRKREAEMLSFTEKLTDKNVHLQTEFSDVEAKANELQKEEEEQNVVLTSLKNDVSRLQEELKLEQSRRSEESRLLARQVAEKAAKAQQLEVSLTESQSELNMLRNKYSTALKELQKELQISNKKIHQYEAGLGSSGSSDSMCQDSRTSSLNSLNDNSSQISLYQVLDVPAQTLVERIVRLKHESAKQIEKIEFLEEHTAHLLKEVQNKTKLLQNYILREETTGALTSKSMDKNKYAVIGWSKLKTTAELSKHGGIMASLYSSKTVDDTMTLDLCMEINRKLQAVLEDTLLKNITLKENLDTLGDEIARLSQANVK